MGACFQSPFTLAYAISLDCSPFHCVAQNFVQERSRGFATPTDHNFETGALPVVALRFVLCCASLARQNQHSRLKLSDHRRGLVVDCERP